ncbi:DUF5777 family beta-barrel protein [Paracnuella aquatica]|uniref:DUF5777 family beta-barrel protein n=1 Tax=Paracnuella aquatica TaxID=2268757 RepID=UPI000DEEAD11|nr:DUF5777 family beta-barrel protein [Paracnuella aquatica]RPD49081.1 hypothetical protein DRJ53_08165 [Paracnuella aquatica]
MNLKAFCATVFLLPALAVDAQDTTDLLQQISPQQPEQELVYNAYKSSRVIMSQSLEMLRPGVLDFRILHRFGRVNQGIKELFGLDDASIRLGFDYGVSNNLTVGIGRGSYRKELDGFVKWRALQQATGLRPVPFSLVLVGGSTIVTAPWSTPNPKFKFGHRVGYFAQVLAGRKFSEALTIQVMPTFLHRNLVETQRDKNGLFAAGVGGRAKLSKRTSVNVDYYYITNRNSGRGLHNPLSIGIDVETGGHVFQMHVTNAIGMNERVFLTETTNSWGKGDIQFGFNISRAFQVKKKALK